MGYPEVEIGQTYSFGEEIECSIYLPGSSEPQPFNLQSPNGSGTFSFSILEIQESKFRNGKGENKRGYCEYEVKLIFDYNNHWMELHKLLVASKITISYPTPFGFLNSHDFILSNSEVVKKWLGNLPVTKKTRSRFFGKTGISKEIRRYYDVRDANPVPDGEVKLEFVSIKPFTPLEVLQFIWFEPVVEPPSISFWFGDPNSLSGKTPENDGSYIQIYAGGTPASLNLVTGSYFYVIQTEGQFITSIEGYLLQEPYYKLLGYNTDGFPVYVVNLQAYSIPYNIRGVKLSEKSDPIQVFIEAYYKIYLETQDTDGEELSKYITYSNIDNTSVIWEYRGKIYVRLNEVKSNPSDSILQYSINGGSSWVTLNYGTSYYSLDYNGFTYLFFNTPAINQDILIRVLEGNLPNSKTTQVTARVLYALKASIEIQPITGEPDSQVAPTSTVTDADGEVIEAVYDFKNYVYLVTDRQNLSNVTVQYSLDNVTWNSTEFEIITLGGWDYVKVLITQFGFLCYLRILDENLNGTSRVVNFFANWINEENIETTPLTFVIPSILLDFTGSEIIELTAKIDIS